MPCRWTADRADGCRTAGRVTWPSGPDGGVLLSSYFWTEPARLEALPRRDRQPAVARPRGLRHLPAGSSPTSRPAWRSRCGPPATTAASGSPSAPTTRVAASSTAQSSATGADDVAPGTPDRQRLLRQARQQRRPPGRLLRRRRRVPAWSRSTTGWRPRPIDLRIGGARPSLRRPAGQGREPPRHDQPGHARGRASAIESRGHDQLGEPPRRAGTDAWRRGPPYVADFRSCSTTPASPG